MKRVLALWRSQYPTFNTFQAVWPALTVFILGLVAASLLQWSANTNTEKLNQIQFDTQTQRVQSIIQTRMVAYEQILRGGVSLMGTLDNVSRTQWAAYVAQLNVETNFPGIHWIGYAEYVPQTAKAAFLQRIRSQGLPDYDIRPAGNREAYIPVTYLEPNTPRNLQALGFDMFSEPTRHMALAQARDTGQPAITDRLKLTSEPGTPTNTFVNFSNFGFLVYLPVYHSDQPTDTVAQRRTALRGFVNSPFRINDLMQNLLSGMKDGINLRIYDGTSALPEALMYDEQETSPSVSTPHLGLQENNKVKTMTLYNHNWLLELTALPNFSPQHNVSGLSILLPGISISLLLSLLTLVLSARFRMILHSQQHYFRLSNFDTLTKLPNRAMFNDRLERNRLQAQRGGFTLAVLFVDIDRFKAVNDNLGHGVGDALLQEIAIRMETCMRKADTVARLGGDEFTVILCDLKDANDAGNIAQMILNKLAEPFALDGKMLSISVSIGIALYPSDAIESAQLLKNADVAMYAAKRLGRGRFQYFAATAPDGFMPTAQFNRPNEESRG